jgi:hypothetical protein
MTADWETRLFELLGGSRILGTGGIASALDFHELVVRGLPVNSVCSVIRTLGIEEGALTPGR